MHIEKNICDSLLGTLLNLEEKSKDNLKAHQDLQQMQIRPELHPVLLPNAKYNKRGVKYSLRCKYVKQEDTTKEMLYNLEKSKCPSTIGYQMWVGLVNYFFSEKFQEKKYFFHRVWVVLSLEMLWVLFSYVWYSRTFCGCVGMRLSYSCSLVLTVILSVSYMTCFDSLMISLVFLIEITSLLSFAYRNRYFWYHINSKRALGALSIALVTVCFP